VQDLAQKAGADVFVSGGILKMGPGFRLDLRVQDTGSGKVLLSERVEGDSPQAIFSMVDETTDHIVSRLSPGEVVVRPGAAKLTSNFNALHAYEDGISYQNRYLTDQAVASFRRATEFDPQFAMAYYEVAGMLSSYSESHEALARAALAAERQGLPEHQKLLIRARQLRFDGRSDEAIQTLRTIVRHFPRESEPRFHLGVLLREEGRLTESAELLEETAKVDDSKESIIWNELAYTYAFQGDLSRALDAVDKYAALLPPNDPNPIDTRADIYALCGHLDKAITEFKRNLESHPEFSDAREKVALAYLLVGRNREAEEAARTAYQKASGVDRAFARNIQGDVALGRGDLALAAKYFEQAARISGTDQPWLTSAASWKAAEIYFEQREPEAALAWAKRTPGFGAAEVRSVAYLLLNNGAEAEKEFASARSTMAPYFGDYRVEQYIAFDRLRAASYSNQWRQVIAGWSDLRGYMKAHYAFFPGRAYTELALFPQAERELRTGLRWVSPGYLVGSYSDFLCDELSQFYLGKVFEHEGKKADVIKSYRAFLTPFEHSTARLPQISEARGAIRRLE
jgi:Flp pilus assembly protein TadD